MFFKPLKTAVVFSALVAAAVLPVQAEDFPTRGLEFVAGYGPGGGHDTMLRSMAKVIRETNLIDASVNVVNKPGGAGATSLGYLNSHEGDGHYLMAATSSFITTPLTADVGLNYKDFTPIARLGIDPTLLVVPASSDIKTLDDIKNAGRVLNVAGGGRGQIEHIATIMVSDALDVKLNFVPFQGDGEVASALLGRQVDFAMINPGAVSEFIKSGRMNAIAISTEQRAEMFPDVPTFKERAMMWSPRFSVVSLLPRIFRQKPRLICPKWLSVCRKPRNGPNSISNQTGSFLVISMLMLLLPIWKRPTASMKPTCPILVS
ncbi:Bug family tripartite tricarboxylate transporter substrate binding protein [Cohaesibacter marisflavi]|uniref:Bug family tripartite tricarboxylate transporter substrate binding protein n=1 Tax=Cohaesibacter marisflavi TaxID=655353 RepID=UPI0029C68092|nr:tripartite tricarboxylate transporter substrate binding protein [Cohaesibacter marisflavi]